MSDKPDIAGARSHVIEEVIRLTRRLRAAGVDVPATAALPAVKALVAVGLDDRDRARTALFAALVRDPADREAFDSAFATFWYRLRIGLDAAAVGDEGEETATEMPPAASASEASPGDDASAIEGEGGDGPTSGRRVAKTQSEAGDNPEETGHAGSYSTAGRRSAIGVETTTNVDMAALGQFEAALANLAGRRWNRSGVGDDVDARRALRDSLDTGGVTVELPRRERTRSALRMTLLVDVSRSVLDAIDREYLLAVVQGLVEASRDGRAFFFDTALREVTDAFDGDQGDPAQTLAAAEVDWGGGTRIGESVATLRREYPHAVDRRTAVVVVSDGLDVGDVDKLEAGMAWLARRAAAVVWLNPLAAAANYEPTCRGMAAALPYIDGLFAFAGNSDLAEAARQLDRHGPKGPIGFQQDFRDREVPA